jgi:hypothetical protein
MLGDAALDVGGNARVQLPISAPHHVKIPFNLFFRHAYLYNPAFSHAIESPLTGN